VAHCGLLYVEPRTDVRGGVRVLLAEGHMSERGGERDDCADSDEHGSCAGHVRDRFDEELDASDEAHPTKKVEWCCEHGYEQGSLVEHERVPDHSECRADTHYTSPLNGLR